MHLGLIRLTRYETCKNPIELDDYANGCYALYQAENPCEKTFYYFEPDREEENSNEPRCDYILTTDDNSLIATRFIELKGDNKKRNKKCCADEWEHAFHQLYSTYCKYAECIQPNEKYTFILCTSIEKGRINAPLFTKSAWYRKLREDISGGITVLYDGECDTLY